MARRISLLSGAVRGAGAAAALLVVGLVLACGDAEEEVAPAQTGASATPHVTPAPAATTTATPAPSSGELTVTPGSGPIGTTVVLEGSGCNNPGQPAYLVFENGEETGTATVGAETVAADIPVDEAGQFRITYTIPSEFAPGSLQGRGGGSVEPGVYFFNSRPVICQTKFLVTAAELPGTGGRPQSRTEMGGCPTDMDVAGAIL